MSFVECRCVCGGKKVAQGKNTFPPGVSVHANEDDLTLLMTAASNTRAIYGKTRINIFMPHRLKHTYCNTSHKQHTQRQKREKRKLEHETASG